MHKITSNVPYHVFSSSMQGYLLLKFKIINRCSKGRKSNSCFNNDDCRLRGMICCQDFDLKNSFFVKQFIISIKETKKEKLILQNF
jgi:hypothetical protein